MTLKRGTTLAGYRINGILGQGGMGVVYEATQVSLNRTVALKVLAPHLSGDAAFRERFQREGQIQAGMDHDHIVTVHDSGDSEHGFFIAMRLIRGQNLKEMIAGRGLAPGRTLRILDPIASALDAAHAAGLIHRDVKPQNILVRGHDQAFLADFGLTKDTGETSLTRSGELLGTLAYVSPEQVDGGRAGTQSDVYALAAVLYECLAGVVPFPRDFAPAVLYAHKHAEPPKVTERRPELPAALDAVIATGMAKNPAARHASAGELLLAANLSLTARDDAASTQGRPIRAPQEIVDASASQTEAAPDVAVAGREATGERRVKASGLPAETPSTLKLPVDPAATPKAPAARRPRSAGAKREATPAVVSAAVLLLVIVVGLGFLVGRSGGTEQTAALGADSSAAAGALELSFPNSWRRAANPPAIPGLELQDRLDLGRRERSSADVLSAGTTDATGPALLPAALLDRLAAPPERADAVRLGELAAYRYAGLQPKGFDRRLTLYVAPTSAGVVTVACVAGAASAMTFLPACEAVADSLRLVTGEAFALGADRDYLAKLGGAIDRLNDARARDGGRLRQATTQRGQASAASDLAKGYGRARSALAGLEVSPGVRDASASVTKAMLDTESAYRLLAHAARSDSGTSYEKARRQARRGEAALKRALAEVGAAY